MHIRTALAAAAVATLFSVPAFGALVVDFTGNLPDTGTNTPMSLNGTVNSNGGVISSVTAFSDNARNGLDLAGFPRVTVASSYNTTGATSAGLRQLSYRVTDTGLDRLQFQFNAPTATPAVAATFDALMLVYKQDFASLTDETIEFDSASFIKFSKPTAAGVTGLNIVVKNGDVFYMSTTNWVGVANPNTLNDLPGSNWVSFDPTANGGDISSLASVASGGSPVMFDNVQAVGFFFEGATATTGSRTIAFNNWTVEASAVPEPGAIGVLGGAVAFGVLGRRKHA